MKRSTLLIMRWTENMTYDFVKMYEKYECLWKPNDPNYKIKEEREKAYKRFSEDFYNKTQNLLPVLEVKRKLKNLRTTYMQQVNKIFEKSTPENIYKPRLYWFQAMDNFLKNVNRNLEPSMERPNHKENLSQEVPSSTQNEIEIETSVEEYNQQYHMPVENSNSNMTDHHATNILDVSMDLKTDPLTTNSDDEECLSKFKKRKFTSKKIYKKNIKLKNKPHVQTILGKDSNFEDEFDVYGKFIATQLRSMDLPKALQTQLAIQNLINKARLSS